MSPDKSKTETITQRRAYVYLPTIDKKEEWEELAEERGQSLSKFIVEQVQDSLKGKDEDFESRLELLEKKKELEEELKEAKRDLELYRKRNEKLEKEVKEYRSKQFLETSTRQFSRDLIDLLRENQYVKFEEIYDKMEIDPTDEDMVRSFQEQLRTLEEYGLVTEEERGWRWEG